MKLRFFLVLNFVVFILTSPITTYSQNETDSDFRITQKIDRPFEGYSPGAWALSPKARYFYTFGFNRESQNQNLVVHDIKANDTYAVAPFFTGGASVGNLLVSPSGRDIAIQFNDSDSIFIYQAEFSEMGLIESVVLSSIVETDSVYDIEFATDSTLLVVENNRVIKVDLETGEKERFYSASERIRGLAFNNDSGTLVVALDELVEVSNTREDGKNQKYEIELDPILQRRTNVSRDGRYVVSPSTYLARRSTPGDIMRAIRIFDTVAGEYTHDIVTGIVVDETYFSSNGEHLIIKPSQFDKDLMVYSTRERRLLKLPESIGAIAREVYFGNDSQTLAVRAGRSFYLLERTN